MRSSVYPSRVVFHDNAAVIAKLKAKAEREGVTFSEVMRRATRREALEAA
jgi:hypothetical protein